jgi:glutamate-1-semialdehyde 2,1-aminomutase
MDLNKSSALFERAKHFIPGGVNSPVRAFRAVGGNPVFIRRAKGPYLFDEDGNQFVDDPRACSSHDRGRHQRSAG